MTISSLQLSSFSPCSSSSACHGTELRSGLHLRGASIITGGGLYSFAINRRPPDGTVSCNSASTSGREHDAIGGPRETHIAEQETCEAITFNLDGLRNTNNAKLATTIRANNLKPCSQYPQDFPYATGSTEQNKHLRNGNRVSSSSSSSSVSTLSNLPFAAVSANALFTIESTPLRDRIESFDKLNWKGKAYVSAILACALVATAFAGTKLVQGVRQLAEKQKMAGKSEDSGGGSPYEIIAKGFSTVQSNLGPWSLQDLILGLAAISKVTEKRPPNPPGNPAKEVAKDASFLARAQHWRAMAEAVYTFDPASFSLQSQLPESAIVAAEWTPNPDTLRPAYVVCMDAPYGAVVLSVRGTSQVVDMLVNSGASADSFLGGRGHGGFVHATNKLIEEVVPVIRRAFEEHSKTQKDLKLVITGHSMGAAVGIMAGLQLKKEYPNVECWGYSTPACVTIETARGCKDYVTSFVAHHDIVPRFSITAVELLRKRICDFDWEGAEKIAHGDEDWNKIKSAADNLKSVQTKQQEVSNSVQKAQEGVGAQIQDMHEKVDSPLCNDEKKEEPKDEEEKDREGKEHPPLYPPGRLFVLASDPPGCGKLPGDRKNVPDQRSFGAFPTFDEAKKVSWVLHEADQEDFKEIVVSPWSISDHMLANLGEGLGYLQLHCEPAFGGPSPK